MTKGKPPTPAAVARAKRQRHAARAMTDGSTCSAIVQQYAPGIGDGVDLASITERCDEIVQRVGAGDLAPLEAMLLAQATALQAMFVHLSLTAKQQTARDNLLTTTSLALKAAAGSRQAIVALAELRMPKAGPVFARQANINNGGQQQVNNGNNGMPTPASLSRAEESSGRPSELSGASHELLEDTGTSRSAGGADPQLEAVGAINRAAHRRGQGAHVAQRVQGRIPGEAARAGTGVERGSARAAGDTAPAPA